MKKWKNEKIKKMNKIYKWTNEKNEVKKKRIKYFLKEINSKNEKLDN
jgi:hypothetical protein